jgi:hypothetical protein
VANGLDMFHDMFEASGGKCEGPGRGSVKFGVNPIETYREIHHADSTFTICLLHVSRYVSRYVSAY